MSGPDHLRGGSDILDDPQSLSRLLSAATRELAAKGISTPRADAEWLAAHVLGVSRGTLALRSSLTDSEATKLWALINRRAAREPLQHLTGVAGFRRLELSVGPGVFVPRPETEVLVEYALAAAVEIRASDPQRRLRLVDLGAGSGAIALSMATELPAIDVRAVEVSPAAAEWTERNIAACGPALAESGSTVTLLRSDAMDALEAGLITGPVDLVVANPPYIPDGAVPRDPEVRDHDPARALFGGPDGLDVVRQWVEVAAAVLRPGGALLLEHGDEQGDAGSAASVPALLRMDARWSRIRDYPDLTGRPRVTSATRCS